MVQATQKRETNKQGGTMPHGTTLAKPLVVTEEADPDAVVYTIITPERDFNEVRLKRQFRNGRATTTDENVAREFVETYGYSCEPELPAPPPRKRSQRRDRGFASA